jgi:GH35 family endo-1,4-beta-xylanase
MCKRLVFLSALAVTVFSAMAAYSQSVVIRDDFEISYDGWTDTGAYTKVTAVAEAGYNSSRGMKVTGRRLPSEGAMSAKGFYIDGGEPYGYSVYVKHGGTRAETFNLTVRYFMPDYNAYGYASVASAVAEPNSWTLLEAKYASPAGTVNQTFFITTNSVADFCFDEFTVTGRKPPVLAKAMANEGLKDVYANKFRVGSVLNGGTVKNSTITAMIIKEFNSITCENEMKPDATIKQSGSTTDNIQAQINSSAASILKFCSDNGIGVRGHTLTWHSQTPQWFFKDNLQNGGNWVTPSVMDKRLESYIKNMFALIKAEYPNLNLYAYDVTNEAVSDNSNNTSGTKDGARDPGYGDGKSPWVQIYGNNTWIEKAFTYARKYAPSNCKLFYNDYNEYWDHKRDCIARSIITPLKQKGVLDGMGMQSHINADVNGFTGTSAIRTAVEKYANIGVEVQLTELDISTEGGKFTLQQQGKKYADVFRIALNTKPANGGKVTAVCVWGPNDANSWVGTDNATGKSNAPLLFDNDTRKKPAYDSVFALVPQSEWGDGNNPSFGGNPAPTITVSCNVDNLSDSYISGAFVPRPNVSCGTGTPGTASFSINGAAIDGWNSVGGTHQLYNTGSRTVVLNNLTCGTTVVTPPAPVTCGSFEIVERQTQDANGYYFYHTYEDGTDNGWSGRWANVANTDAQKANGSRALAVTGRNASYTGAEYSLKTNAFVPGGEYSFSVLAMYPAGDSARATDSFKFTMTYTLRDTVRYAEVATAVANAGAWVMLENQNFTIPAGAAGLVLYVEMPGNETGNFFIDDAMGGVAGTAAPGRDGVTSVRGSATGGQYAQRTLSVRGRTLAVNAPEGSSVRVKVVNLRGKTLAAFKSTGSAKFSLRRIPAGVYIVEAVRDGHKAISAITLR